MVTSFIVAVLLAAVFIFTFDRKVSAASNSDTTLSDESLKSVQASHSRPTSRMGGVALFGSFYLTTLVYGPTSMWPIVLCSIPVFLLGLSEDLRRENSPKIRLAVGAATSAATIALTGVWITSADVSGLNWLFAIIPFAVIFTVFASTGMINAFNLIDGVNGLASGHVILSSVALGLIANSYGDADIAQLSFMIAAATAGFFVLNFPFGRIFLGDAGAYTLGFLLAWIVIVFLARHPEASAWSMLAVMFWPVMDTAFSILRRKSTKARTDQPDRMHFHQMVMRFWEVASNGRLTSNVSNPLAAATILPLAALPILGGYVFVDNNLIAFAVVAASAGGFIFAYRLGVRVVKRKRSRQMLQTVMAPVFDFALSEGTRTVRTPAE